MIGLSISILWFVLGVIILLAVIWFALYAVRLFTPIPDPIEKLIWVAVLILILIGVLTLLGGGGSFPIHLGR